MRQTEADNLHPNRAGRSTKRPASFPDVLLYRGKTAEGEDCLVTFDRQTIVLSRPVAGLACRIRLSVAQYDAVAVVISHEGLTIRLMHDDAGLSIDLAEMPDLEQAEEYRDRLAGFLDLPAVTMGGVRPSASPNTTVLNGGRTGLMKRRRARFLTRRQTGNVVELRKFEGGELIARN